MAISTGCYVTFPESMDQQLIGKQAYNDRGLTPGLPMLVVTPKDFIDSSPIVATTKGVKMGPGH